MLICYKQNMWAAFFEKNFKIENETVHAINVTNSAVLQTVTVAVQLTVG